MPELPEVETTCRGIAPHIIGRRVKRVIVRERRLRWPVPASLSRTLIGAQFLTVHRRAKYILLGTDRGTAIVHLGMSGSLRVLDGDYPPFAHDHLDVVMDDGQVLRYTDPRRFGCWLWTRGNPKAHPLLESLGPEPLSDEFTGEYLFARSRGRKVPVKSFIMDGHIVVGVGNIYASEALHRAGIHPKRGAGRIAATRYERLATEIREVLAWAIREGGTTLRDYTQSDGNPGYFAIKLQVYDREGSPCRTCGTPIRAQVIGQRSSYYCPACQN